MPDQWDGPRVRTAPYYPQSNGKIERWHGSLKAEAIRPKTPLNLEDARRVVGTFVEECNTKRLHSAIGYVTPHGPLGGPAHADLGGASSMSGGTVRITPGPIPGITGTSSR